MPKPNRVCEQCGKDFHAYPSYIKKGRGRYCTKQCGYLAQRKPLESHKCEHCGREFVLSRKHLGQRHCSHACRGLGGRQGKTVSCEGCGKSFYVPKARLDQGQGKYCSHSCAMRAYWVARHDAEVYRLAVTLLKGGTDAKT